MGLGSTAGYSASTLDQYAQSNSSTYAEGKAAYTSGKEAYDSGRSGFDSVTAPTIEEAYGENWSGGVSSDPTLSELRAALDSAAAAGEATRSARESDFRSRVRTFSILAGPAGVLFWAMSEAFLWIGGMFARDVEGNTPADKSDVDVAVRWLWTRWRVNPPTFAADVASSARSYAALVRWYIAYLDATEVDDPTWREQWVSVVDHTTKLIEEKKYDVLRDASLMGLFPLQIEKWAPGYAGLLAPHSGVGWGERYVSGADKYGDPQHSTTMTLEQMKRLSDPFAAGIGLMVAAYTGAKWEPCIEAAVTANAVHAMAVGADLYAQNWRFRAVFLDTMRAAVEGESRFRAGAAVVLDSAATAAAQSSTSHLRAFRLDWLASGVVASPVADPASSESTAATSPAPTAPISPVKAVAATAAVGAVVSLFVTSAGAAIRRRLIGF